jgi:hypothetical protein
VAFVGDESISALVVLRPAVGDLAGTAQITADTVEAFAPDPAAATAVRAFLTEVGFDVQPLVGISCAVVGPRSLFERTFGTSIPSEGSELPLDRLPDDVAGGIQAVTFTPPPAFGPTGEFSV